MDVATPAGATDHDAATEDDWAEDAWTDWFRARLATNGGKKEIRKPTLKWKDVRSHLENGPVGWLRVEIRRADVETDEVLSAVAKSNSHNDYYLRGILLPDGWPILPAEYLCRFQPAWIDDDTGRYV
jgi:hypothetical protein